MPTTIESLELEVKQNGSSAVQGIDALSASLTRLKSATKGGMGLTSVANQLRNLNTALNSMDASAPDKISKLANSLDKLKSLGSLKISSSIASQIKNIGSAASSLAGVDFSGVNQMTSAITGLGSVTKSAGLQSAITQLNKIPELAKTLNGVDWGQFSSNIDRLTRSLSPLATQLNTVSAAFTRLPSNIQRLVTNTNNLSNANNTASKSYINLYAKLRMAITAVKSAARVLASWITQSNKYVEDLNLFTVALGDGAEQAKEFAETVSELMGIDPADWLRNQGVFNTIIKGFGVANEKALIMSKNLTQLGYDISSFYNISVEDAFTKLQSGIAGELEPLRRLGYDLSVARLQQEAYNLGIERSVNDMTQAEKSQLRYYAIMTQVTDAQGDMARTLNAPANQLRILQAQVTQAARALGNIFIPALNAVLPYAIALAKAIRLVANAIASLFGFSLPEIDYSGLSAGAGAVAEAAESAEDGYGGAAKAAKKLKDNLLGIDELNIIRPDDDSSGGGGGVGGGGGGGFDIELPEYDFLGDLIDSRVDGIMEKLQPMIEWIKTHLDDILDVVLAIGAGFLTWKFANGFVSMIEAIKNGGLNKVALGITLMVTGITLAFSEAYDIGYEGASWENILKTAIGDALIVGGSLLTFGTGPVGWIVGIGIALTATITGIVIGANDRAIAEDLKKRFGELILSSEEISTVVKATLNNDWFSDVKLYLDVEANLGELLEQIEGEVQKLNQYGWKVRLGLELSESEMSDYKSVIDSYVESANRFITDRGYAISVGIKATLKENEIADSILASNDAITALVSDDLTNLGTELQSFLNNAFSDGILTIDEKAAIDTLTNQINNILEIVSQSEFQARLDVIDLKYDMVGLSQESWEAYKEELQGVADEMKLHAETAVENTLSNLKANIAIAEYYLEQDPNNTEWKNALSEAQEAYQLYMDSNPLTLECNNIDFIINDQLFTHFTTLFGDELEKATPLMELKVEDAFYNAFLNGVRTPDEIYEEPIGSLMVGLQDYWMHEFNNLDISSAARKNIHKELADCVPKLSELKTELDKAWKAGNAIPQSVKDGLLDIYTYKAMSSDVTEQMEGVTYLIGYELSESPGFYDMLTKADELGWFLNEELALGIKSNLSFVEDASGDTVDVIKDGVTVETLKITPELRENMKNLGVNLSEGVTEGVDKGLVEEDTRNIFQKISDWFCDLFGIHSPSTVFIAYGEDIVKGLHIGLDSTDEEGVFMGEGLLEGLAKPFKAIDKWVKKNIIDPISNFIKNNPIADLVVNIKNTASEWWNKAKTWWNENAGEGISIEAFVSLAKKGWSSIKGWIGNIPTLPQAIALVKEKWDSVKEWVGNIPIIEQGIKLVKDNWSTVRNWIGNLPSIDQLISLAKNKWSTVADWVKTHIGGAVDKAIGVIRSGWSTIKEWIENSYMGQALNKGIGVVRSDWTSIKAWIENSYMGTAISKGIGVIRSGWSTIKEWIENSYMGSSVSKYIGLTKSWSTVADWVGDRIGGVVSVTVSLVQGWVGTFKRWLGLNQGGVVKANGRYVGDGFSLSARGGVFTHNSAWQPIPSYANGTNKAHGTMFVAGEAGAEIVGHINGTTEVLNRFQMGQIMQSSIVSAMALYLPVWRALNSTLVQSANAIIRSVLVSADAIDMRLANQVTYDPKNILSQSVYEESSNIYGKSRDESSMAATMRDFYREYVEPTLAEIAADAKRQADKEEQTIVQIGNRTINDAVISQQKANGYVFAK